MDLRTSSVEQLSLEKVRAQFDQWRRNRGKREAIPESLLEAASSLYPAFSLNRISRTLGLNYSKLKHYVHEQSTDRSMPSRTTFIELGLSGPAPARQYSVELQHRNGDRID